MQAKLFIMAMQHFITLSNSSKNKSSLLILDNHELHICIEALNLAEKNGVHVFKFPLNITGKLETLDVRVFGPFKSA